MTVYVNVALPFALAVHAVHAVPLGVQLRQRVAYLHHFLPGGVLDHVRLMLV